MNSFRLSKLPKDVMLEVASRHKQLRKNKGLTQQDLAERSGVSLGSIKRFETTGKISLESLLALAHVLRRLDDFDGLFVSTENGANIQDLFSEKMSK